MKTTEFPALFQYTTLWFHNSNLSPKRNDINFFVIGRFGNLRQLKVTASKTDRPRRTPPILLDMKRKLFNLANLGMWGKKKAKLVAEDQENVSARVNIE
jgi:hypothetical protein